MASDVISVIALVIPFSSNILKETKRDDTSCHPDGRITHTSIRVEPMQLIFADGETGLNILGRQFGMLEDPGKLVARQQ